jgi:hypothetical protein
LEKKLAEATLLESKKLLSLDEQRQAEQRRKRNEIDEFNRSVTKPKTIVTSIPGAETLKEEKEFYGNVLKTPVPKQDNSAEYQNSILAQIEEKRRLVENEKQINKQVDLDLLNDSLTEHKKRLQDDIEERKRKQQENREFLLEQMATKQVPLAQLGVSEVQFMSHRLLSTAERKGKQKSDAKSRMSEQLDVIEEKQKLKEKEREDERIYAELQKQQTELARKREADEAAARKNKIREDLSKSLTEQMETSQKAKELEKSLKQDANPYLSIGEKHDEHHKNCKRCGNNIVGPLKRGRGSLNFTTKS